VSKILAQVATAIEFAAAVVVAITAMFAVVAAIRFIPGAAKEIVQLKAGTADLEVMISDLLLAFIAIELMRIALVYIRGVNVLPAVLEAGIVAVVRQVVLFHPADHGLSRAAALSVLVLSIGVLWLLLSRSGAMRRRPAEDNRTPDQSNESP
jgi:uncharacterized membrane protein (DUF373 family)